MVAIALKNSILHLLNDVTGDASIYLLFIQAGLDDTQIITKLNANILQIIMSTYQQVIYPMFTILVSYVSMLTLTN